MTYDSDALNASIKAAIAEANDDLRALSMSIHGKPELAWEEHHAHDVLTAYMEKQEGFVVERKICQLDTAWRASFGSEGPLIGFCSEMDALPGIGHACGHNLIAIAGCAAAIGVARALREHKLPGRVVLLGTPAEESGGGKCLMLERGAFDGMDACLMVHPGPRGNGAAAMTSTCRTGVTVAYSGRSAHAGGAPEKGINALDAAVQGYVNVSTLRQQLPTTTRVHGIIAGGEHWAPNAIPASSKLLYGIRAPSAKDLAPLVPRVLACFASGALATGCTYTTEGQHLYLELQQNSGLSGVFKSFSEGEWGDEGYEVPAGMTTTASTDFGNVSYHVPALHPMFLLPSASPEDFPHSSSFADAASTPSAHQAALRAAEGIAVAGLRVVVDESFRNQIRKEWEADMAASGAEEAIKQIREALPATGEPVKGGFCSCDH
ncbi:Aminoacylase 1-like protein 2 [Leucosporidium creatinivorum]|uniref:Peptidase M20 domain-containing protein 2 n=1 Tax=Leucosporidium creatinivorum TaxID=106004 RepID=A0A1Y2D754_9BASI|nr:Aminoacylase 1-like protein 2 [Leucosporidium creatinivorum]